MYLIARLNQAIALFVFWLIGIVGTVYAFLLLSQAGKMLSPGGSDLTAAELMLGVVVLVASWVSAATSAGVIAATGLAIEYFTKELRTPVRRRRVSPRASVGHPSPRPKPIQGFDEEVIEDAPPPRPEPMSPEEAQRFLDDQQ